MTWLLIRTIKTLIIHSRCRTTSCRCDRLAALVGELKGKKKRKVEEDEDDE